MRAFETTGVTQEPTLAVEYSFRRGRPRWLSIPNFQCTSALVMLLRYAAQRAAKISAARHTAKRVTVKGSQTSGVVHKIANLPKTGTSYPTRALVRLRADNSRAGIGLYQEDRVEEKKRDTPRR